MKLRALILVVMLAACGQNAAKGPNAPERPRTPEDMQIQIGRYGVMLDQVHSLTAERPGANEQAPTEPMAMARALRETVWQYNVERSQLCGRGLFTEIACGPSYQPVWISEAADAAPSFEELQNRSAAVGGEVMRFWNAVCEDARTRETNQQDKMYVCAIE
jgi:hypothetical protein